MGVIATLSQNIDTPNETFELLFDYEFLTAAGVLVVKLDGQQIGAVTAPPTLKGIFIRERVLVNDPVLMGLVNKLLSFELIPGSPVDVKLANAGVFKNLSDFDDPRATVNAKIYDDFSRKVIELSDSDSDPFFASLSIVSDGTFANDMASIATAELPPIVGPIAGTFNSIEGTDSIRNYPVASSQADALGGYRIIYTGPGPAPTDPVAIDLALNITGSLEFVGPDDSATVTVLVGFSSSHVEIYPLFSSTILHRMRGPGTVDSGGLRGWQGLPEDIFPDDATAQLPGGKKVGVVTREIIKNFVYAPVNSVLAMQFMLFTTVSSLGNPIDEEPNVGAIADFLNTMEGVLTSSTPGIEIVPVTDGVVPEAQDINYGLAGGWFNTDTPG